MPYLQNALTFTIETIVGLYLIVTVLRFLFQTFRVDFRNPVSQMVVTLTHPPLKFLRGFIPGLFGIDLACVVLVLLVGIIKTALLLSLSGLPVDVVGLFVLALAEALNIAIWILIIAILISAVLSWFGQANLHPAARLVHEVSAPVLHPFRRILPPIGGIDLTPILAFLVLRLAITLLVHPLTDLGRQLIFQ